MNSKTKLDYLDPCTTVIHLVFEGDLCQSPVRFDANIQDYNSLEGEAPEEGEVDYLF